MGSSSRDEPLLPAPSGSRSSRRRPLGVASVLALVFFNVSGGPLGSEGIISAAGPLCGIVAMVVFVVVFSVPQAMITAELSTAFPDNGGYSLWVQAAFGDFWAVQESYWSWFSGVVDSALYPVLMYSSTAPLLGHAAAAHGDGTRNVLQCLGSDSSCGVEFGLKLLILLVFALPNLLSSRVVGLGALTLAVAVLSPYAVLCVVAAPQFELANLLRPPPKPRLGSMLSVLYWSLSGFDSASTFAGEVDRPSATFPRALCLAVVLMLLCYVLPLGLAAGADPHWESWRDGSLSVVARRLGGEWLGVLVMCSSALSNWGLFSSELLEDSFQLLGMAEAGLAPRCFSTRHPRVGTPIVAICVQLLMIGLLVGVDFEIIMCVDNFFSAAAAALEFAAAVQLRAHRPDLPRPFRIPMPTTTLALVLLLPFGVSVGVMYVTAAHSRLTLVLCTIALLFGFLGYPIFYRRRRSSLQPLSDSPVGGGVVHTADLTPTTSHAINADAVPSAAEQRQAR